MNFQPRQNLLARWFSMVITLALLGAITACTIAPAPTTAIPTRNPGSPVLVPSPAPSANPAGGSTIPAPTPENKLGASPTPVPEPLSAQNRTSYRLEASLEMASHSLEILEVIGYTNNTGVTLDHLLLVIPPNQKQTLLSFGKSTWESGQEIVMSGATRPDVTVDLPAPLQPGQKIVLNARFTLSLPNEHGVLGFAGTQTNLGDWYPYIPPYQPEKGWIYHPPTGIGENLVYPLADFEVTLKVINPPDGLVIAASLPLDQQGETWHGTTIARNVTFSVSTEYALLQKKVGATDIRVYVFPYHLPAGQVALETIEKALVLYSQHFAPYPHPSLSMVEGTFPDGMEYDGLFFLGMEYFYSYLRTPLSYLVSLTAHETAHQWWYGLVGDDPAMEPWLDEAFCTYSELLFFENTYPDLVGGWWDFRVNRFAPSGIVNSTIFDFNEFRPYVNAVYLQGARFLAELRQMVGDGAFLSILHLEATRYAGKIITTSNFFDLVSSQSPADISTLKARYFR